MAFFIHSREWKMQTNESDSLVLTPTETAKLLRIGRGTVYEQIRLGVIPSVRLGRRILVPRVALMRMLETVSCRQAGGGN